MQQAIEQFRQNLARVKNIHAIYLRFSAMVTPAVDLSDILRAEIVMIVSALDHYVHEVTRLGMLEVFEGKRPSTPAFLRFDVSLECMLGTIGGAASMTWLESEIRTRHGFQSFQNPERIADALRLFSGVELWKAVALELGEEPKSLKDRVQLLVERRNKIAHEADLDPSFPGVLWPINPPMVEHAIQFVSSLCEAIHRVAL
ncbi:MAG TPA: HEPN domain-containing protein [Candidatus Dormibacteraeota bacterium]|jgi:hypothetical protein|nr:HEPN domain-containing protein [Candidatus Dormibacteraeota bacterium]